ncbi:MAG: DUF350 domain-containing protein [Myxococcales bacterium]|nr:DUF350 domain-containing protein [Myxococcales bacterium]MCB9568884.1 DUF350 domain-containing protein [Myxococcales bacterium]MCB9704894.1 DUF350 domain-containing protein [Myxococcales bacterium]
MNLGDLPNNLIAASLFSVLGLILFGVFWAIVVRVSPFSIKKEIVEDQNTALGIILGAMLIGIALIISAAVSG